MNDETQTEQPEDEDFPDFDELVNGLSSGIQLVINNDDEEIEYVLCVHHVDQGLVGMSTNAKPKQALDMVMQVGQKMYAEVEEDNPAVEPVIILPH